MAQAEQLERQQAAAKSPASGKAVEVAADDDDDEEADVAGLDTGDINLVMTQAKCSKAKGESMRTRAAEVGRLK